jgi:hypothetical protein
MSRQGWRSLRPVNADECGVGRSPVERVRHLRPIGRKHVTELGMLLVPGFPLDLPGDQSSGSSLSRSPLGRWGGATT